MSPDGDIAWILRQPKAPLFPWTPAKEASTLGFVQRLEEQDTSHCFTHWHIHTQKIKSNFKGRKEEATGQSDRHNAHGQTSTGYPWRPLLTSDTARGHCAAPVPTPGSSMSLLDFGGCRYLSSHTRSSHSSAWYIAGTEYAY